ncbi:energy transducer TonB [Novosphingobium sp.]|uniref:energy transducer TonB n=1 Tax=Novosphingobium sp. TaxID=1874826 RepID=UPI003BA8ABDF
MLKLALGSTCALLLAASSLPAWAGTPLGPRPSGDPGSWVTPDDYPAPSLRDEQEGVVGFVLTVDPTGVPSACNVTQTSNFEALDTQTCNLLMLRARFVAAHDAKGRAVEGTYRNSIRWVIPEGEPTEMAPAEVVGSFVIGTDGKQRDCTVDKLTGPPALSGSFALCSPKERFVVATGKDGKPIARRVRLHVVIEVEDLPGAQ